MHFWLTKERERERKKNSLHFAKIYIHEENKPLDFLFGRSKNYI